jgi:hypothetical protein
MLHNRKPMHYAPWASLAAEVLIIREHRQHWLTIGLIVIVGWCAVTLTEGRPIDRRGRRHFHFICQSMAQLETGRQGVAAAKWPTRRMCFHRCGCLGRNTSSWSGVPGPRRSFFFGFDCTTCHRILSLICGAEILKMRTRRSKTLTGALVLEKQQAALFAENIDR